MFRFDHLLAIIAPDWTSRVHTKPTAESVVGFLTSTVFDSPINSKPLRKISGHKWQKVRKRIIARECGLCQACMRNGKVSIGTEVDHIKALQHGGTDDDDNLQLLCHDCHADKTAAEDGKRRRFEIGQDGWPKR